MPNTGVRGRIVWADPPKGRKAQQLKIVAVDIDFSPDEEWLGCALTDPDDPEARFEIKYCAEQYRKWQKNKEPKDRGEFNYPDIVLRVYTSGGRLVFTSKTYKNVSEDILEVEPIRLHPLGVSGWLVTHATLNPTSAEAVRLTKCNAVEWLIDGEVFPRLTDDALKAGTALFRLRDGRHELVPTDSQSIHLMNLRFYASKGLITKFAKDHPQEGKKTLGTRLHEVLRKKPAHIPVRVLVNDLPFDQWDKFDELKEFFDGSPVKVRGYDNPGNSVMHAKAVILCDENGFRAAFVMGATLHQEYHNDKEHRIRDPKRGSSGQITHDVNARVTGPAVTDIDRTFTTVWNAAQSSSAPLAPSTVCHGTPGSVGIQTLRTLPGGIFTKKHTGEKAIPHGETGILEAYQRAIENATDYIYLETQYFTSPDIVTALIKSLRRRAKLQVLIIVPIKPHEPLYQKLQIRCLRQLQAAGRKFGFDERLGIFTLWSCCLSKASKKLEVMPIYVHSKVGIADDKWATVGSANLDGASLNQTQFHGLSWGLAPRVSEAIFGVTGLALVPLMIVSIPWALILFAAWAALAVVFRWLIDLEPDKQPAQHANPSQSLQPDRSTELNVVVYSDEAGLPQNDRVAELRRRLWSEHLGEDVGLAPPRKKRRRPSRPGVTADTDVDDPDQQRTSVEYWCDRASRKKRRQPSRRGVTADTAVDDADQQSTWVEYWCDRASEKLECIKKGKAHSARVLEWKAETDPGKYLRALGVDTKCKKINVRGVKGADQFDFETGQWIPAPPVYYFQWF